MGELYLYSTGCGIFAVIDAYSWLVHIFACPDLSDRGFVTSLSHMLALTAAAFRPKAVAWEWKLNWRTILLGGILAPGGYTLFLYALTLAPAAQLAPMREIGTVFGTLFGLLLLNEPQGRSRIIGSVLITAGVIGLGFT
jgi:uncharacterized membrane protein